MGSSIYALGGLEAVEGYLSTDVDLTKQVKPSFALPPTVKCSKTERRKVCVCVSETMH